MEPDSVCGSAPPGLVRDVGLDVDTLRGLLREQTNLIRESGNRALEEAMTKIQLRHEEYCGLIEARVQQLSD